MKNSRHLITLAVTTLLLVILATVFVNLDRKSTQQTVSGKLFPELKNEINNAAHIEISDSGNTATLTLEDGQWHIVEEDNYFADVGKIKKLLLELSELELVEAKTKIAANYHKLGVDDLEGSGTARKIVVRDNTDKQLAAVILGNNRPGVAANLYVRKVDDEQSWLVKGPITASSFTKSWLDKNPIRMESKDVAKIMINPDSGEALALTRDSADAKLQLPQTPDGQQLKDISTLQSALQSLSFDEVVKADSINLPATASRRIEYSNFDGLTLSLDIYKHDDKNYVKISATGGDSGTTLNKRLDGWLYLFPQYQLDKFNKNPEDLLQTVTEN